MNSSTHAQAGLEGKALRPVSDIEGLEAPGLRRSIE